MRPSLSARISMNHDAPSGAAVMTDGRDCGSTGYAVPPPPFVTRAIEPLYASVTYIAPSGPAAGGYGRPSTETLNAAVTPA
jgi:hypothetical protein